MEYKDFVEYIKENAAYIAGEGGKITINHVIKNNGREMDGLVIMEKDRDIAPTIYLDSFYEMYIQGENIKKIIRQIETIYRENRYHTSEYLIWRLYFTACWIIVVERVQQH